MHKKFRTLAALLLALGLLAAACGSDDSEDGEESSDTTAAADGESAAACDELPLKTEGTLTVATGEPAFPPWVGPDDDPTTGEGFESALVYALAEELGIAEDSVEWVRTGFGTANIGLTLP